MLYENPLFDSTKRPTLYLGKPQKQVIPNAQFPPLL